MKYSRNEMTGIAEAKKHKCKNCVIKVGIQFCKALEIRTHIHTIHELNISWENYYRFCRHIKGNEFESTVSKYHLNVKENIT